MNPAAPLTLIRGGRLIDPAAGIDEKKDLLLRDGRVAEVAAPGRIRLASEHAALVVTLDATGLVVAPGLIDIHVHLREPGQTHKETIATGTAAAAAGGFTAVAAMPNTVPTNDTPEITRWMQSSERGASARVFPIAAATRGLRGEQINDFAALKAAGAVAVTDDGHPILRDNIMREVLAAATRHGLPVIQHAEDTRLTEGASMNAGALAFRLGLRGMPPEAEYGLVERDIRLVAELDRESKGAHPHLHVAHTSTAQAVAAVHQARRNGLRVTCEVAPHHFLLTEQHIGCYNTHAKMNPPLRSEADRAALWARFRRGEVPCLASDHAPHSLDTKDRPFDLAPSGMPGVETMLPLMLARVRASELELGTLVAAASDRPSRWVGQPRGRLAVGHRADLLVVDFRARTRLEARRLHASCGWTAFEGWEAIFPREHYLRGERIVEDGQYIGRSVGEVVRPEYARSHPPARTRTGARP